MSIPGSGSPLLLATTTAAAAADAAYVIPKSLRFNSGDSAHLSRPRQLQEIAGLLLFHLGLKRVKRNNQHLLETASSPEYTCGLLRTIS